MSRNNAPVPYTCPTINRVIGIIECLKTEDNESDIKDAIDLMEEIRFANDKLRDWGEGLLEEKEDLEKNVDNLEWEVKKLNDQIEYLQLEIKQAEEYQS